LIGMPSDVPQSAELPRRPHQWLYLAGFVLLCLGVGLVGGQITAPALVGWYPSLAKPAFTPPDWLFGPVWTALYGLMGVAVWRVWRTPPRPGRRRALGLFFLQLALNLAWVLLFFGAQAIGAAAIELAVLFALVVLTSRAFGSIERVAGLLLLPYAAWLAFALLLNVEIWRLN
jgi:tryptophan-rich sensory protein